MAEKIRMPINSAAFTKMFEYAFYAHKHFNAEIAGWGHYSKTKGIYKLAPLSKQIVEGVEVNNFPDDILNDIKYDISDMIVQWHSHVNGSCAPSGANGDEGNIVKILKVMPVVISIIVNCRNEYSARLSYSSIKGSTYSFDLPSIISYNLELVPYYDNSSISKEVLAKCKRPKLVIPVQAPLIQTEEELFDDYIPPFSEQYELQSSTPGFMVISSDTFKKAAEILKDIAGSSQNLIYSGNDEKAIYSVFDNLSQIYIILTPTDCNVNGTKHGSVYMNILNFVNMTGIDYPKEKIKLW